MYFSAWRGILYLEMAAMNNLGTEENYFAVCAETRQDEGKVPVICSATGVVPFRLDAR